MLHPHDGRVAEATQENMDKAAAGTLSLSFPFLIEQKSKATPSVEEDKNTNRSEEVLRRITHVKELKGRLNTQQSWMFRDTFLSVSVSLCQCLVSVSVSNLESLGKWSCLDREMKKFWI